MEKSQKHNSQPIKGKQFWGDPLWKTLHIFAATLRQENAKHYKTLLECYSELIPCENCKKNFKYKLEHYPVDAYLTNNHDAFFYSYLLHDLVNSHITKEHPETPKVSPNYDDIKSDYFRALSQECKECGS